MYRVIKKSDLAAWLMSLGAQASTHTVLLRNRPTLGRGLTGARLY